MKAVLAVGVVLAGAIAQVSAQGRWSVAIPACPFSPFSGEYCGACPCAAKNPNFKPYRPASLAAGACTTDCECPGLQTCSLGRTKLASRAGDFSPGQCQDNGATNCFSPEYQQREGVNNICASACDCDGARACSGVNVCTGKSRPSCLPCGKDYIPANEHSGYFYQEASGGKCTNACQCDGARTCTNGQCVGVARSADYCLREAYTFDEVKNPLGPFKCKTDCDCNGRRACDNTGRCVGNAYCAKSETFLYDELVSLDADIRSYQPGRESTLQCDNDCDCDGNRVCWGTFGVNRACEGVARPAGLCTSPSWTHDEKSNNPGPGKCIDACDCNGVRVCEFADTHNGNCADPPAGATDTGTTDAAGAAGAGTTADGASSTEADPSP